MSGMGDRRFDRDDAMELEKALLACIYDDLPFAYGKVTGRDDETAYDGNTRCYDDGDVEFRYRRREMCEPTITMRDMAALFVTMCHEAYGHGTQIYDVYRSNTRMSRVLSANFYAAHASDNYYYGRIDEDGRVSLDSYFKQPHEMAAQYVGLVKAYNFMAFFLDPGTASDAICEYVNHRIDLGSEFIDRRDDKPYERASDVFDEFRRTFPDVVYAHKDFDVDLAAREEGSPFAEYHSKNPSYCEAVSGLGNGCDQDARMAEIYYECVDERECRIISNVSCFRHDPLSLVVDHVGKATKSPVGLKLEKLAKEIDTNDAFDDEDDDSFDFS